MAQKVLIDLTLNLVGQEENEEENYQENPRFKFNKKRQHVVMEGSSSNSPIISSSTSQEGTLKLEKTIMPAGTPVPVTEVIALSPNSLMATNKFVCERCHKGFAREQNLQIHRTTHNLDWVMKERKNEEAIKKIKKYICPDKDCAHNDPERALGDMTGMKKHYMRKHGEKKLSCWKCQRKYAVQTDLKAHIKNCVTKQYRCDCGTICSSKQSLITHRALCEIQRLMRSTTTPAICQRADQMGATSSKPSASSSSSWASATALLVNNHNHHYGNNPTSSTFVTTTGNPVPNDGMTRDFLGATISKPSSSSAAATLSLVNNNHHHYGNNPATTTETPVPNDGMTRDFLSLIGSCHPFV